MLNFNLKGTYKDNTGYTWDFYRDDQLGPDPDPNVFYIVPKPQFVMDATGKPIIQIQTYQTDGKNNGSGFCKFQVELGVPANVSAGISSFILSDKTKFSGVTKPIFQSLSLNPGSKATAEFQVETEKYSSTVEASDFGGDTANFLLSLNKVQLDSLKAILSKKGGSIDLTYHLSVPARLQSVSALLTFDSAIAYKYQVTQPTYNGWGDETSPGSAKGFLTSSASSHFKPVWGISNPPSSLVNEVTSWANSTIADLVSAEVQDVIATKGLKSSESFSINEVSSFSANFEANTVVKWIIEPNAILPSLADLGLNISDFEGPINEQTQQMVVTTNLPFTGKKNKTTIKLPKDKKGATVSVKSVTVTVKYPGLPQAKSKVIFSCNGSHTFSTPYVPDHGSTWSLGYTVDYDSTEVPPISGSIDNITSAQQYLKLQEVGFLVVQFDAGQAFANEFIKPDEIDVRFAYNNPSGNTADEVTQLLKFLKTDKSHIQLVSSLSPLPISNTYNYQVTYTYNGVSYKAPLVQNKNGFSQIIPAVNTVHLTNIIAYLSPSKAATNPLLQATLQIWFEDTKNLPTGVTNQPSEASPATYTLNPGTLSNGGIFVKATFTGVKIANTPIVYTATIDFAASEQVMIPATKLAFDTSSSIMLNAVNRYFTLEVDANSLAWSGAKFNQVQVLITFYKTMGGTRTKDIQESLTWNKGETGTRYLTIPYAHGTETVSYDVEIDYPPLSTPYKKTGLTDIIFDVPSTAPAGS